MILSRPLQTSEEKYYNLLLNNSSEKTYRNFVLGLIDEFEHTGDFTIFYLINKIIEENISENIRSIFENIVPAVINISRYKNIEIYFYPSPDEMKNLMEKFDRFKRILTEPQVDVRTEINTLYLFVKAAFETLEEKYENKQDMLLFYQATVLSLLSWLSISNLVAIRKITIQNIANHDDLSLLIIRFANQFKPKEYELYTLGRSLVELNNFFKALRKAHPYPYNKKKNNEESSYPFNRVLEDFIFQNYEECKEKLTEKMLENGTTKRRIEKKRAHFLEELSISRHSAEQRPLKKPNSKWENYSLNSDEFYEELEKPYSRAKACTAFGNVKKITNQPRSRAAENSSCSIF